MQSEIRQGCNAMKRLRLRQGKASSGPMSSISKAQQQYNSAQEMTSIFADRHMPPQA